MSRATGTVNVNKRVVNIQINRGDPLPTGFYNNMGCCTVHQEPCECGGTTCSEKAVPITGNYERTSKGDK